MLQYKCTGQIDYV